MLRASQSVTVKDAARQVTSSLARRLYCAGILVLAVTWVVGGILNPRAKSGVSVVVDTFEAPLLALSFILCAAAPFVSSSAYTWIERSGLFLIALVVYAVALVVLSLLSIAIFDAPIQD